MKKSIGSILSVFVFIICHSYAKGQSEEFYSTAKYGNTMATNDTISVIMSADATPCNTNGMQSAVILRMDPYSNACMPAFTATLGLEVQYNDTLFGSPQTKNITLTLNYDPAAGKTTTDRVVYYLPASRRVRAKITSMSTSLGSMPGYIVLETYIKREKHCKIDVSGTPITFNTIDATSNPDQLVISWGTFSGAEEYDLEWVYIDDYKDYVSSTHTYFTASELNYTFKNNATRVTLQGSSNTRFALKKIYEHGYLLFRVRPVGRFGSDYKQRWEGPWSTGAESGIVNSYGTSNKNKYQITAGHEDSLNWQWTTTYAEEAKYKTVVSYFDGGLRSRQTVTHNNTDSFTIVGESMYDHVGRKAIDALPVPTGDSVIKYYDAFNNRLGTSTPYGWRDFEIGSGTPCLNTLLGMDTLRGASKYYSNNNPNKKDFQAYVPKAFNYPFVQTEYTPDMTGKVRRQSGVGVDHKMESGKETKYFYGTPGSQQELDALFGVEVGYYRHYKKEMTVDANGSVSVSYMNPGGKVIATALAGKNPSNLSILPTDTTKQVLVENLSDKNVASADSNMWTASHEFMLSQPSGIKLEYKFKDLRAAIACSPSKCYDCIYDLHMELIDQCGNQLYVKDTIGIKPFDDSCNVQDSFRLVTWQSAQLPIGSYQLVKTLKINEDAMYKYEAVFLANNTCVRSYEEIYDSIVEQMDTSDCNQTCQSCATSLGTQSDYKAARLLETPYGYPRNRDSLAIIYSNAYGQLCAQYYDPNDSTLLPLGFCEDHLGFSMEHYRDSLLLRDSLQRDSVIASLNSKFAGQWQSAYDDCMELCDTLDECEGPYKLLLQDVSPGGQYLEYDLIYNSGTGKYKVSTLNYPFSLLRDSILPLLPQYPLTSHVDSTRNFKNKSITYYNEDGSLSLVLDIDGVLKTPNYLSADVFIANWRPSWAESLVKLHPEYGYYQFCIEQMQAANRFNRVMMYTETYADASAKNLFNPLTIDSFYVTGQPGNWKRNDMQSAITTNVTGYPYSMSQMAVVMTFCSEAKTTAEINACLAANTFGSGTTEQKNQQWEYFRSLYQAVRQRHIDSSRANDANTKNFANCRIGHQREISTSCTTAFTNDSLINRQRIYIDNYKLVGIDGSGSISTITSAASAKVNAGIATQCASQCNSYADYWMTQLAGCALSSSDSTLLRNRLIAICMDGCDIYNPLGSSMAKPSSTLTYKTFKEAINSVKISGKLCNENLISMPMEYGHDYGNTGFVKIDDCFKDKWNAITNACSRSKESIWTDSIFKKVYQTQSTMVKPTDLRLDAAVMGSNALRDSVDKIIGGYLMPGTLSYPQAKYYTTYDGSGNLIVHLKASYDGKSDQECTIKIFKVPGHTSSFFDSVKVMDTLISLYSNNCGTNEAGQNATITLTTKNNVSYTTGAYSTCFPLCEANGTASRIQAGFLANNCVNMSVSDIKQIGKYLCGDTTAIPLIPRDLSCKPACITCDSYKVAQADFKTKYTGIYTLTLNGKNHLDLTDTFGNVATDTNFRKAFTNYMNNYFSFNKSYEDYMKFKDNCEKYYKSSVSYVGGSYSPYSQANFLNIKNGCTWPVGLDSAYRDTLLNLLSMCNEAMSTLVAYQPLSCRDLKLSLAAQEATYIRENELQLFRANFRSEYLRQCRQVIFSENFRLTYTEQEYHYTLYYYDQAGNLVKTVPPAGVDYITNSTKLAQIKTDRIAMAAPGSGNTPAHNLATRYKYNTLNQVYEQSTPDGGTSTFFYDKLGRMVVSQNAKQDAMSGEVYSFTLYDNLGRITEVGQIKAASAISDATAKNPSLLATWVNAALGADNVTRTIYDDTASGYGSFFGGKQENLRNRVSYMYTVKEFLQYPNNSRKETEVYTLFSYDLHGNVKTLVQDIRALSMVSDNGSGRFRMDYDNDLISGNVHKVSYQAGKQDRFFHYYRYDGDNRLVSASTSRDGIFKEEDAKYYYYQHGSLARVETGKLKVQGTDFAYTIHGWLKGVNSGSLDTLRDMGKDGWASAGNLNRLIPKDLFGFTLGYYYGDYYQIKPMVDADKFEIQYASASTWDAASSSLYNGNIRHMVTAIGKFMEGNGRPMGYAYQYDHLNRLSNMYAWDSINMSTNAWVAGMKVKQDYHNRFTYDANGNILTQVRRGSMAKNLALDSLNYHYASGTNQLTYVSDVVDVANYKDDIDNQVADNYKYDAIGNLIQDKSEEIDTIKWNVYGKITDIIRTTSSKKPDLQFAYGPDGQRISKKAIWNDSSKTEYYVRDAQGNIMATYNETNAYLVVNVDSSYNTVIGMLIDSIGINNFANFIKTKYASDTAFNNRINNYLPDTAQLNGMTLQTMLDCSGDKLFGLVFDCCEGCDDANARTMMESIMAGNNFLNTLMECNLEKLLLAVIKENKVDFFNQLDMQMNPYTMPNPPLSNQLTIYFNTTPTPGYRPFSGNYLTNDVPSGYMVKFLLNDLVSTIPLGSLNQPMAVQLIKNALTNMNLNEIKDALRLQWSPCDFLKCIGSCSGNGYSANTPNTCTNAYTSYIETAYNNKRIWSPEPNLAAVRGSIAGGYTLNNLISCDQEALIRAFLQRNAQDFIDAYRAQYGTPATQMLSDYFANAYEPDTMPFPAAVASRVRYLATRVPIELLAVRLNTLGMTTHSATFSTFLNNYVTSRSINLDQFLRDYYRDCDIKKCVIETGIVPQTYTAVSMINYLKNQLGNYTLSNAILCNPALNTNKVQQSFVHNFSNAKVSSCGGTSLFDEGLKNIPYGRLTQWFDSKKPFDAFEYLLNCDNQQVLEMLYDYDTKLFIQEASNAYNSMYGANALCNYFQPAPYPAGTYVMTGECSQYLQTIVPKHKVIERLLAALPNFGTFDLQQIVQQFATVYNGKMDEVAFKYFNECDLRTCAKPYYNSMSNSDSSEIFSYLKEEKWTAILKQVKSCYKDSFNYNFAKAYPGFVAEIFENRHYPLISFMNDIEAYFDTTMRNKLDGDTVTQVQYYAVNEFHMYGSSRLGIYESGDTAIKVLRTYDFSRSENIMGKGLSVNSLKYNKFATDSMAILKHGNKRYEGTNHLGNVLVVYSDKRLPALCQADTVVFRKADLIAATDYSPFGAPIKQFYVSGDTGCKMYSYTVCQTTGIASSFDKEVSKNGDYILDGAYTWKPVYPGTNIDTITVNGNRKLKVSATVSGQQYALLDQTLPVNTLCTLSFDLQLYYSTPFTAIFQLYYYDGTNYVQQGSYNFTTNGLKTITFTSHASYGNYRLRFHSSSVESGRYFTVDDFTLIYPDQCQSIAVASSFDNYVAKSGNNFVDGSHTWMPVSPGTNLDTITVNGNRKLKVNASVTSQMYALIDQTLPVNRPCTLNVNIRRTSSFTVVMRMYYYNGSTYVQQGTDYNFTTEGLNKITFTSNASYGNYRFRFHAGVATGRYYTLDDFILTYADTLEAMNCDGSNGYKFGFNGQEKDNEVSGAGNSYTAEFWQYDSRLGRRFNLDPKPQISISDYAAFRNNPIIFIDPNGDEVINGDKIKSDQATSHYNNLSKEKDKFMEENGITAQTKKKDFLESGGTKKQWKEYKRLDKKVNESKEKMENWKERAAITQGIIDKWAQESPNIFKEANEQEIDMILTSKSFFNTGIGGITKSKFDEEGNLTVPKSFTNYGKPAIHVEIDENVKISSMDMGTMQYNLNHEAGHFLYIVQNQKKYFNYTEENKRKGIPHNGGHNPDDESGKKAHEYGNNKDKTP